MRKDSIVKPSTLPLDPLIGKRIAFKSDEAHRTCWHATVGLRTGMVLRVALTLAEKAKIMSEGGLPAPHLLEMEEEKPRIWVKADPCQSHPRGCEVAVDRECLIVQEA
jgi:hypothetical protein